MIVINAVKALLLHPSTQTLNRNIGTKRKRWRCRFHCIKLGHKAVTYYICIKQRPDSLLRNCIKEIYFQLAKSFTKLCHLTRIFEELLEFTICQFNWKSHFVFHNKTCPRICDLCMEEDLLSTTSDSMLFCLKCKQTILTTFLGYG